MLVAAAWTLSALPLVLAAWIEVGSSSPAAHLGLVALPWIALASAPGSKRSALWLALSLPLLAFAARLDHAASGEFPLVGFAGALALLALSAFASSRGTGPARTVLWALLVIAFPVLLWVVAPLSADGAPAFLEAIASFSPVAAPASLLAAGELEWLRPGIGVVALYFAAEFDRRGSNDSKGEVA